MTRDLPDAKRLTQALQQKGWQPARGDVEPLFALVATGDKDAAEAASRALARLGADAAQAAMARFDAAPPVARARLTRLVGRVAQKRRDRSLADFLLARVGDADEKTARNAALALGKLGELIAAADVEGALVARWPAASPPLRRALAEALGKVGSAAALAVLDVAGDDMGDDKATPSCAASPTKRASRSSAPSAAPTRARIVDDVAPLQPLARARPLPPRPRPAARRRARSLRARVVDDETVSLTLRAPLSSLWTARTMLRFGFPLPTRGDDAERAVVDALTSRRGLGHLFALHPRHAALSPRVGRRRPSPRAHLPRRRRRRRAPPALVNDPTETLWEVVVREERARATVELWPRGLHRLRASPIASPTSRRRRIRRSRPRSRASPARRPDDVVWDPFVGAATELVERARLGPARALYGTDADDARPRARPREPRRPPRSRPS